MDRTEIALGSSSLVRLPGDGLVAFRKRLQMHWLKNPRQQVAPSHPDP